jgi:hypothetical protein
MGNEQFLIVILVVVVLYLWLIHPITDHLSIKSDNLYLYLDKNNNAKLTAVPNSNWNILAMGSNTAFIRHTNGLYLDETLKGVQTPSKWKLKGNRLQAKNKLFLTVINNKVSLRTQGDNQSWDIV